MNLTSAFAPVAVPAGNSAVDIRHSDRAPSDFGESSVTPPVPGSSGKKSGPNFEDDLRSYMQGAPAGAQPAANPQQPAPPADSAAQASSPPGAVNPQNTLALLDGIFGALQSSRALEQNQTNCCSQQPAALDPSANTEFDFTAVRVETITAIEQMPNGAAVSVLFGANPRPSAVAAELQPLTLPQPAANLGALSEAGAVAQTLLAASETGEILAQAQLEAASKEQASAPALNLGAFSQDVKGLDLSRLPSSAALQGPAVVNDTGEVVSQASVVAPAVQDAVAPAETELAVVGSRGGLLADRGSGFSVVKAPLENLGQELAQIAAHEAGRNIVVPHAVAVNPAAANNAQAARQALPVAAQIGDAILARAEVVVRDGRTEIHIRLEPPELGRVTVHLTATENTITARLVVHEESARQLIESQLQSLRQRLTDGGISLGRFDVTRDGAGSQGQPWQQSRPEPVPPAFSPVAGPASPAPRALDAPVRSRRLIDVMV